MSHNLVAPLDGLINRAIFSDQDVYEAEQEAIFGRCWLFLGHESLVSNPGDYMTTFMGEDPIILTRDKAGTVHALLNTCRHRGNRVCLFDRGNTAGFVCSYHGWRYGIDGKLINVPFYEGAYLGELDRGKWGLVEVPRLEMHGGLIFGCWDPGAVSLEEYLGDTVWYLDRLVLGQGGEGIDFLPGHDGYLVRANWKIIAENFAGDHYHTLFTHRSSFKLGLMPVIGEEKTQAPEGPFEVAFPRGHGIGGIYTGQPPFERDLERARKSAHPELAEEYVRDRYARMRAAYPDRPAIPYSATHGTIFPNLLFSGRGGGALAARGFYMLHPRGPLQTEIWQWIAVERDMPELLRVGAVQGTRDEGQLASGLFAQDDAENFERVTESSTPQARKVPLNLQMTLAHEGHWPGQSVWDIEGLPGLIGPRFSEHSQRNMYKRWAELMREGS